MSVGTVRHFDQIYAIAILHFSHSISIKTFSERKTILNWY